MEIKDKLYKLLDVLETKQLDKIFKRYMEEKGVKKLDLRKKDKSNVYVSEGKDEGCDRVICYYYKGKFNLGESNLAIALRKRSGYYLIITRRGEKVFERENKEIQTYDEILFKKIMEEYKELFDELLVLAED